MKTFFLLALHVFCIWAEAVLWQKPFDMPVPAFMTVIGLVWLIAIVLSFYHAYEIWRWLNTPSPDIAEIIRQDQERRRLELERMYANQWVDP